MRKVNDNPTKGRFYGTYIGIVKEVEDGKMAGRLRVWIPELKTLEDDKNGWVLCNYCSPFGGSTTWRSVDNEIFNDYEKTQSSYGFWAVPPDLENEVLVTFVSGDINKAYWFGCTYQEFMNSSVPSVPASIKNKNKNGTLLPVTEYNKYDKKDSSNPTSPVRPWHKYKTMSIGRQGLIKDKIRGLSSSSSMRETPSQVYGMSTPGPLHPTINGIRLGGHSFVMDDNPINEHITMSTRGGAKIRLDETNGLVYIINKKGTGWIQIDDDGRIDVYGDSDISIRSKGNFNLRADRNINIEAGNSINIKAAMNIDGDGKFVEDGNGQGGDIVFNAMNDFNVIAIKDIEVKVVEGNYTETIETGSKLSQINTNNEILVGVDMFTKISSNHKLEISGTSNIQASSVSVKTSNMILEESGNVKFSGNIISSGNMFASDFKAGGLSLVAHTHTCPDGVTGTGTGGGGSSSASTPAIDVESELQEIEVIDLLEPIEKTNILSTYPKTTIKANGNSNIEIDDWWNRDKEEIGTIVSRFPTLEPYQEHKNKGE